MYSWLMDYNSYIHLGLSLFALVTGSSARTIKILKSPNAEVIRSVDLFVRHISESIPLGIVCMVGVPHFYPTIKEPELLALLVIVGVFSPEIWNLVKTRIVKEQNEKF